MIRDCVERGARSLEEIGRACQAGTACGGCIPTIDALIAGEPADEGVVSLGKARVRERAVAVACEATVAVAVEVEVEVDVDVEIAGQPAVARAS